MGWVLLGIGVVLGVFALVGMYLFSPSRSSPPLQPIRSASPPPKPRPEASLRPQADLSSDMERLYREAQAETQKQFAETLREMEREAAIEHEEWERQIKKEAEPDPQPTVRRSDYVPKEDEARFLTRDADGLPDLRLVDAGDRLAIWSSLDGGALINPRGAGLRQMGLYSTAARGSNYHRKAFRAADLRRGRWLDLKREPDNKHDKNAVAMPPRPERYERVGIDVRSLLTGAG